MLIIATKENGKIVMTEEEFRKYIQDSYNEGYEEGKRSNSNFTWPLNTTPYPAEPLPITYCNTTTIPNQSEDFNLQVKCSNDDNDNTNTKKTIW